MCTRIRIVRVLFFTSDASPYTLSEFLVLLSFALEFLFVVFCFLFAVLRFGSCLIFLCAVQHFLVLVMFPSVCDAEFLHLWMCGCVGARVCAVVSL